MQLDEHTAVLITDLTDGRVILSHRPSAVFPSASLIKLFLLYSCLYRKLDMTQKYPITASDTVDYSVIREQGIREATLSELLFTMIGDSDNTATNVVISSLGFDAINADIATLGCGNTACRRKMLDYEAIRAGRENTTCAQDVQRVYTALFALGGQRFLAAQKDRQRLLRYIFGNVMFYGKSGDMQGAIHDTGVIAVPGKEVFAAVLTKDLAREDAYALCGQAGLTALGKTGGIYLA